MTPFRACGRTATISLSAEEEALVRLGRVEMAIAESILTKLRKSLEISDILLRPIAKSRAQVPKSVRAAVSLEDLGL